MEACAWRHLPPKGSVRLLVVGDLILDEYLRGNVSRISPEAPVPVLESATSEQALGGAANVAGNLRALGCGVDLCGTVGDDTRGHTLLRLMANRGIETAGVVPILGRPTTHKLRVVAQVQHMLRIDHEVKGPLTAVQAAHAHAQLRERAESLGKPGGLHGVVISDYRKGYLCPRSIAELIATARQAGVPVVVDPKGTDYAMYRGADVLTPNLAELHAATRMPVGTPEELDAAASELLHVTGAQAILVTCGKDGMVVVTAAGKQTRIAAQAREVYDVTGAGDTVIATFALSYCAGAPVVEAARAANVAASIAVGKLGTATVSHHELQDALDANDNPSGHAKVLTCDGAVALSQRLRARGRRVVFTNGCFDLLHAGHVTYLQAARAMGDALIVGLNTDRGIARLKGPNRPLTPQDERATVLSALGCVDAVVLFDEPTPADLLLRLTPDVLVKGADYEGKTVVGRDTVEASGGQVVLVPMLQGRSTSNLVETILERYGGEGQQCAP